MTEGIINQTLEFAVSKEKEAAAYYRQGAKIATNSQGAKLFLEMAAQEEKHQLKIENLNPQEIDFNQSGKMPDLRISENLPELTINPDMDYQSILTVAIKNEEHSLSLYKGLAYHTQDKALQDIFNWLANEEAKHKLHLEEEYEREFLSDN